MSVVSIKQTFDYARNSLIQPDLRIQQVTNERDLLNAIDTGLTTLYQNAFSEPPYNEKFEDDEVYKIMLGIIQSSGFLFTAVSNDSLGKIIAFVASVPLTERQDVAELLGSRVNINTDSYFAEDAVNLEFRRRGISAYMKEILLQANAEKGYQRMVLRTSADEKNAQLPAVLKSGFTPITEIFQDVISMKKDGNEGLDRRCFFLYDLQTLKL